MNEEKKLSPLESHEQFLVGALDCATSTEIAEIRVDEIVGLTGEFSPKDIIGNFATETDRIADVLERCNGTKRPLALRTAQKPARAIDELNDALEMKATTPEELYQVVTSNDLVRWQDAKRVWALLFRHRWTEQRTEPRTRLASKLLAAVIELKLLTPQEIIEQISTDQIMGDNMPSALRKRALDLALKLARITDSEGKAKKAMPFDDQQLLVAIKADDLALNIDLTVIERVFIAVAKKFKMLEEPKPVVAAPAAAADTVEDAGEPIGDDSKTPTNPPPPPRPGESDAPAIEMEETSAGPVFPSASGEDRANNDPREVSNAVGKNPALVDDAIEAIRTDNKPNDESDSSPTRIMAAPPRPIAPAEKPTIPLPRNKAALPSSGKK